MINFNQPTQLGFEVKAINKLLKNNKNLSSGSYFTEKCINFLKKQLNLKYVLLTGSCTAALEMVAILINIKKGDEVIIPSFSFVSTANAFVLRGAKIVYADVNQADLNLDLEDLQNKITRKTKAIVAVHYAGYSCNLKALKKITQKKKIFLIEDAAQGVFSKFENTNLGSIGDFGCYSFHETKNIHCGQGGALIFNNKKFYNNALHLRDKGTNKSTINQNKKYEWISLGSSYALTEILSAYLYLQLVNWKKIIKKRIKLWKLYNTFFNKSHFKNIILKNNYPKNYIKLGNYNAHIFYLILNKNFNRNKIIEKLKKRKIICTSHYEPLHLSKFSKKIFSKKYNLKNTEFISKQIIRLPLHNNLTTSEVKYVCKSVEKVIIQTH